MSRPLNLPSLGPSLRALFTGYLLVVSVGLSMAGAQILLTHGMADGRLGLSVDDIVFSYYGNRGNSRLETMLNGTMKDNADEQERATIIKWVRGGATEPDYDASVAPVVADNCLKCHGGAIPGLADFSTYDKLKPFTKFDEGKTVDGLTRVSHIHLFGIAFIFFFVCGIFTLAIRVPKIVKTAAIASPFLFLVVDIGAWWATKWFPGAAYFTILGGAAYNAAAAFMIVTSLYQMWIMPRRGRAPFPEDAWADE